MQEMNALQSKKLKNNCEREELKHETLARHAVAKRCINHIE